MKHNTEDARSEDCYSTVEGKHTYSRTDNSCTDETKRGRGRNRYKDGEEGTGNKGRDKAKAVNKKEETRGKKRKSHFRRR